MRTTLNIQNLKCGGCENQVSTQISKIEGISDVVVSNEQDTVSFDYNRLSRVEEVINQLAKMGYPLVGDKNTLGQKAKSYVSCMAGRMQK